MRHFLIDTDTASDDAVALIIAVQDPSIRVEAITVVAGNVPVEQGIQNALYTLSLCQKQIPVYKGASKPLVRPLHTAQFVHGQDGMGDIGLDLQGRSPAAGNAADVIIDTIHRFADQLEIVTLGPLTNLAIALLKDPSITGKVKTCTVMGGIGYGYGNVTPVSEYNIWADPEAAQVVFQSGLPLKMVGWDISRTYAWLDQTLTQEFKAIGTALATFAMDIQRKVDLYATQSSKLPGFDLPDPIAMAIAIDHSVATETRHLYVEVIASEGVTRGQTIVDHTGIMEKSPNVAVVLGASRKKFLAMLRRSLL
jgi:purine nucleosidase